MSAARPFKVALGVEKKRREEKEAIAMTGVFYIKDEK